MGFVHLAKDRHLWHLVVAARNSSTHGLFCVTRICRYWLQSIGCITTQLLGMSRPKVHTKSNKT